jgi:ribosome-binding protein aMBF1 (putative translation factor)
MSDLDVLEKELRRRVRNFDKKYSLAQARLAVALEIAKERERAGLSQKELAAKLKTTQSVISRIESGRQNVSLELLQRMAEAFGKRRAEVVFR